MYTFESMISDLLQGDKAQIDAYFSCFQAPLGKSIKVMEHRIAVDAFIQLAQKYGWSLEKQPFTSNNDVFYISREDETNGLGKHWLHTDGFFYIQEVAASLPVQFLDVQPGDMVLDMCSAPGGKSVQIADRGAYTVSNEISSSRLIPLQYNLNRTGIYASTVTSIQGGNRGNLLPEFFDRVLVDAPCSGEGTGFKSDDGIKRWQQDNVLKIARLQKELITAAIKTCKIGGTVVYSTCTINPWENEGVVSFALEKFGGIIHLEPVDIAGKSPGITHWEDKQLLGKEDADKVARFWPHVQKTGGFFIAKFTKLASYTSNQETKPVAPKQSQLDISPALQEKVSAMLLEDFGIQIDPAKHLFISSQKKVYLTHPHYSRLHNRIHTEKSGVPIFKINNNGEWSPLHNLGQTLGSVAVKNVIQLPEDVLQRYSEGFDIPWEGAALTTKNRYAILKRENHGFGVAKLVDGYLKNKFLK